MLDRTLNRDINKLFNRLTKRIYANDIERDDAKDWWPIRPVILDYALSPFLFKELIKIFKEADQKYSDKEIASFFSSKDVIDEYQFVWIAFGFTKTDISFEDKLYLMTKLINLNKLLKPDPDFIHTYKTLEQITKISNKTTLENVVAEGVKIYFSYLTKLYQGLGLDYEATLDKAITEAVERAPYVKDPGPWEDTSEKEAMRKLIRNGDFRREKEKELEPILNGVPEVPGIAEGEIGKNVAVVFSIEKLNTEVDAYITDIDAFRDPNDWAKAVEAGIVVVAKTRSGTKRLLEGQKVWVDGTSGIVYSNP